MNKRKLWIAILPAGLLPFFLPFFSGLYHMWLGSWTMFDWVVMYSFVYWPTYIIGLLIISFAIYRLLHSENK